MNHHNADVIVNKYRWKYDDKVLKFVLEANQYVSSANFNTLITSNSTVNTVRSTEDSTLYVFKNNYFYAQTPYYGSTPPVNSGVIKQEERIWKNTGLSVVPGQNTDFINNGGQWRPSSGELTIRDFGGSPSATGAINSQAANAMIAYSRFNTGFECIINEGTWNFDSPIYMKSGVVLKGRGWQKTFLVATASFTGDGIIVVDSSVTTGGYNYKSQISDFGFKQTNTGIRAISCAKSYSYVITNVIFKNLHFETSYCIDLLRNVSSSNVYTQACRFERLFSLGNMESFLRFSGNANYIYDIDKEGGVGTNYDAYIHIDNTSGDCNNNIFRDILLEGGGSTTKRYANLINANNTLFDNFWFEASTSSDTLLYVNNSKAVEFHNMSAQLTYVATNRKFTFDTSYVYFDRFDFGTEDNSLLEKTFRYTNSYIKIGTATVRRGGWGRVNTSANLTIENIEYTTLKTGILPTAKVLTQGGINLLSNSSFERGTTGWTTGGTITVSDTIGFSNIGRCAKITAFGTTGQHNLSQTYTITPDMVGQPLTLKATVKSLTSTGVICLVPTMSGTILGDNSINRVYNDGTSTWYHSTISCVPTATGTLSFNIFFLGFQPTDICYIDDCILSVGYGVTATQKASEINFSNGRNIFYSASIPTYTTNVQAGDIALNTASNGTIGWRFNGTSWVEFGNTTTATMTFNTAISANSPSAQQSITVTGLTTATGQGKLSFSGTANGCYITPPEIQAGSVKFYVINPTAGSVTPNIVVRFTADSL